MEFEMIWDSSFVHVRLKGKKKKNEDRSLAPSVLYPLETLATFM